MLYLNETSLHGESEYVIIVSNPGSTGDISVFSTGRVKPHALFISPGTYQQHLILCLIWFGIPSVVYVQVYITYMQEIGGTCIRCYRTKGHQHFFPSRNTDRWNDRFSPSLESSKAQWFAHRCGYFNLSELRSNRSGTVFCRPAYNNWRCSMIDNRNMLVCNNQHILTLPVPYTHILYILVRPESI